MAVAGVNVDLSVRGADVHDTVLSPSYVFEYSFHNKQLFQIDPVIFEYHATGGSQNYL